jgi:hypothetical protein
MRVGPTCQAISSILIALSLRLHSGTSSGWLTSWLEALKKTSEK